MSPSVRRLWLAILTVIVAVIVLRSMLKSKPEASPGPGNSSMESEPSPVDIRTVRQSAPRPRESLQSPTARRTTNITTGVKIISAEPEAPQVNVSGYTVDQFTSWTTIPAGYLADGISVRNGALTLSGDRGSTAPRSGTLESPALQLHQPSLAAPSDNSITIPEGAGVDLQISVSDDGQTWSPWYRVGRYAAPDGKRVTPAMQPTLANADLQRMDSRSSSGVSGPALRYRLGLTASGVAAPSVSDVRIWKRQ